MTSHQYQDSTPEIHVLPAICVTASCGDDDASWDDNNSSAGIVDDFDMFLNMSRSPTGQSFSSDRSDTRRPSSSTDCLESTTAESLSCSPPLCVSDSRLSKYRSKSVKVRRKKSSVADASSSYALVIPFQRPRSSSIARTEQLKGLVEAKQESESLDNWRVLRKFTWTDEGLQCDADSLVRTRGGVYQQFAEPDQFRQRSGSVSVHATASPANFTPIEQWKIQVLGYPSTGKTSICQQFFRYDQFGNSFTGCDEMVEYPIIVTLDEQENHLLLLDTEKCVPENIDFNNFTVLDDVHAYLVVYSVDQAMSFNFAKLVLADLFTDVAKHGTAVILVANKSDLVKARCVSKKEGIDVASRYRVKFVEVSSILPLNLDYLLVGTALQIRRKISQAQTRSSQDDNIDLSAILSHRRQSRGLAWPKAQKDNLVQFFRRKFSGNSCENLVEFS